MQGFGSSFDSLADKLPDMSLPHDKWVEAVRSIPCGFAEYKPQLDDVRQYIWARDHVLHPCDYTETEQDRKDLTLLLEVVKVHSVAAEFCNYFEQGSPKYWEVFFAATRVRDFLTNALTR